MAGGQDEFAFFCVHLKVLKIITMNICDLAKLLLWTECASEGDGDGGAQSMEFF